MKKEESRPVKLSTIMKLAKERGVNINPILDMWNSNKELLFRHYHKARKTKLDKPYDLDIAIDALMKIAKKKKNPVAKKKKVKSAGFAQTMDSLYHEIHFADSYADEELVITINIKSSLSTSVHTIDLRFEIGSDPEDPFIQDEVGRTIKELKFIYLTALNEK